jgi:hypothetical protein
VTYVLPVSPGELAMTVIENAYSHFARIECCPAGGQRIDARQASDLPAILLQPNSDQPRIGRTGRWASVRLKLLTAHPDAHLELSAADLTDEYGYVLPGYLPPEYEHIKLKLVPENAYRGQARSFRSDNGIYLTAHRWMASARADRP